MKAKWRDVLNGVRKQKMSTYAWLMDGEPVAATERAVLVAFKNEMHCETTRKPDNRQLIEQVMQQVFGKSLALETMMQNEWQTLLPQADEQQQADDALAEPFQLEPEPEPEESQGDEQQPWIKEAIDLFGEQLVVIDDEE